jgi:hypothetical protein
MTASTVWNRRQTRDDRALPDAPGSTARSICKACTVGGTALKSHRIWR